MLSLFLLTLGKFLIRHPKNFFKTIDSIHFHISTFPQMDKIILVNLIIKDLIYFKLERISFI